MMNNLNHIRHIVEGNWEEVKGNIQANWGKLTDSDIDKINGSYKQLIGKLQKLYGYKTHQIENELSEFFESNDFQKIVNKTYNKIAEIKSIVQDTLTEYFQSAKQKSVDTERAIVEYVSDNPFKVIGIAATAGLLIGVLCKSKNN